MPSTVLFIIGTAFLSFNFIRPLGFAISDWLYIAAFIFAFFETLLIERHNMQCWFHNQFFGFVALIIFGAIISTVNSQNRIVALVEICQQVYVLTLFISFNMDSCAEREN